MWLRPLLPLNTCDHAGLDAGLATHRCAACCSAYLEGVDAIIDCTLQIVQQAISAASDHHRRHLHMISTGL